MLRREVARLLVVLVLLLVDGTPKDGATGLLVVVLMLRLRSKEEAGRRAAGETMISD